ncbi:MAG TPA: DNA-3-methyladenine glycosylase [Burkholderiales bacterium]|nr:DNA-3-methyladenine glycosylase [Burkholderiales bacterium]
MKPAYWARAKRALARRDPTLAAIMRAHAGVFLVRRGEPFMTLARAIVGQQISVRAAQSVWDRFVAAAPDATPAQVLALDRRRLRACGLSARKVEYIADLARHFADGTIHVQRWPQMDDEAVIAELVQVRGIGRWTAEMFLIFNLLRPDVFPLDDLGLQKAIRRAYFNGRSATRARMRRLGTTWSPWRSVATWYLWRSLDPVPVEY